MEAAATTETIDLATARRMSTSPREELEAVLEKPSTHIAPPSIIQLKIAAMREAAPATADATDPATAGSPAGAAQSGYARAASGG